MTVELDVALALPKMVKRSQKSRGAAIRLHCLTCSGGQSSEVSACAITSCFLWPWRKGGGKPETRPPCDASAACEAREQGK